MIAFILKIMISGLLLLVGAIALNGLGSLMKLTSWYELLNGKNKKIGLASILWLYIIYPLGLGVLVYEISTRFISK